VETRTRPGPPIPSLMRRSAAVESTGRAWRVLPARPSQKAHWRTVGLGCDTVRAELLTMAWRDSIAKAEAGVAGDEKKSGDEVPPPPRETVSKHFPDNKREKANEHKEHPGRPQPPRERRGR